MELGTSSSNAKVARQRRLITFSYWVSTLADGASRIIIPLYFAALGISATTIGVAFLFYEIFGLLTNLYSGFFINRYGYRRAFLVSLVLHTVASFGYLFLFPEHSLWLTLLLVNVLRAFRGMGKELLKTASSAYFKHLSVGEQKQNRLPIQILLGGKDGFKGLGLLLGGGLLTFLGFKLSFVFLGLLTLICFVVSLRCVSDHREKKQIAYSGFFKIKRKLSLLAGARIFLYASRDLWLVIPVPLYLSSLGVSDISVAAMLAAGLIVFGLSQPLAASQMKTRWVLGGLVLKPKLRCRLLAIWAPILLSLVPLGMLFVQEEMMLFLLGILLYNLIAGVATVPHNHLHLKFARVKRTSVDIAFYKTVSQLGKVGALPVSGLLYTVYGIQGCLIASSVVLLASALLAALLGKKSRVADVSTSSLDRVSSRNRSPVPSFALGTLAGVVILVGVAQLLHLQGARNGENGQETALVSAAKVTAGMPETTMIPRRSVATDSVSAQRTRPACTRSSSGDKCLESGARALAAALVPTVEASTMARNGAAMVPVPKRTPAVHREASPRGAAGALQRTSYRPARLSVRVDDQESAQPERAVAGVASTGEVGLEVDIRTLLERADADLVASRLTTPPGDNAWARFKTVLKRDPHNNRARQGLQRIVARYSELAKSAKAIGKPGQAAIYLSRARAVLFGFQMTDLAELRSHENQPAPKE